MAKAMEKTMKTASKKFKMVVIASFFIEWSVNLTIQAGKSTLIFKQGFKNQHFIRLGSVA
jgi:hypothetical protein